MHDPRAAGATAGHHAFSRREILRVDGGALFGLNLADLLRLETRGPASVPGPRALERSVSNNHRTAAGDRR